MNNKNIEGMKLLNAVNEALKNNISVNNFCASKGLKKSYVRITLNKLGYYYNDTLKAYIKDTEDDTIDDTKDIVILSKDDTIDDTIDDTDMLTIHVEEINTKNKPKSNTKTNTEIKELKKRIQALEDKFKLIECNYTTSNKRSRTKHYINNRRNTSTKNIRLYTEVKERFDEYIKNHKDKKVIEIFSYALMDYMDKYK